MVVVLLTGMSGAGKSTALAGLARHGVETVDTDAPGWIEVVDGEPRWIEHRVAALLDAPRSAPLVVAGAVRNQGRFRHRFDAVVLLTAPLRVLLDRVQQRLDNPFGCTAADRARIAADTAEVEPLLRASATHVVDTTRPPEEVLAVLLRIVAAP